MEFLDLLLTPFIMLAPFVIGVIVLHWASMWVKRSLLKKQNKSRTRGKKTSTDKGTAFKTPREKTKITKEESQTTGASSFNKNYFFIPTWVDECFIIFQYIIAPGFLLRQSLLALFLNGFWLPHYITIELKSEEETLEILLEPNKDPQIPTKLKSAIVTFLCLLTSFSAFINVKMVPDNASFAIWLIYVATFHAAFPLSTELLFIEVINRGKTKSFGLTIAKDITSILGWFAKHGVVFPYLIAIFIWLKYAQYFS